jgi:DNA-directed RNA polymerase subunit RPC12/RpoP
MPHLTKGETPERRILMALQQPTILQQEPYVIACFWCGTPNTLDSLSAYNLYGARCGECGEDLLEKEDWHIKCWSCGKDVGIPESPDADITCPHCHAEV